MKENVEGCWKALFAKIFSFHILLIPKESFQFQELPKKEFLFKISKYIFQTNSDESKGYRFTKRETLSPKWKRTLKGVEKRYLQKFSLFIYCLYLRNPFNSRSYQKRNPFSKYQNTSFRRIAMKRKSIKDSVLRNVKP